jgi:hypothetical protein
MLIRTEFIDFSIRTSSLDDLVIRFTGNIANSQLLTNKQVHSIIVTSFRFPACYVFRQFEMKIDEDT